MTVTEPTAQPAPTMVAGSLVISLPDEAGIAHRIEIFAPGYYALEGRSERRSTLVGSPDYTVQLDAPTLTEPQARMRFPHLGEWDQRYLGYENFWMLLTHYPSEARPGTGERLVLPEIAAETLRLTIRRALVGRLETSITFAALDRIACIRLMRGWMRDRMARTWPAIDGDEGLHQTPLFCAVGSGTVSFLREEEVWVFRHSVPSLESAPAIRSIAYRAGEFHPEAAALAQFGAALLGDGPQWT